MLAGHLGKGLWETINSTSLAEYELWMEWFRQQPGRPERIDYYLMQIAFHVVRGYAKYPGQVKFKDFLLEFEKGTKPEPAKELDERTESMFMQTRWMGLMTKTVRVVKPGEPLPE